MLKNNGMICEWIIISEGQLQRELECLIFEQWVWFEKLHEILSSEER